MISLLFLILIFGIALKVIAEPLPQPLISGHASPLPYHAVSSHYSSDPGGYSYPENSYSKYQGPEYGYSHEQHDSLYSVPDPWELEPLGRGSGGGSGDWHGGHEYGYRNYRGSGYEGRGPRNLEYATTPSGHYDYSPSHQIAEFDQSSYEYEPPLPAAGQFRENYLQHSTYSSPVPKNPWKGIRSTREQRAENTHAESDFFHDSPNYPAPHYQKLQNLYDQSINGNRLPNYDTGGAGKYKDSASEYHSPKPEEPPSYAPPPRSLLKSVFNGITSSISSSLKPMLSYSLPQGWNPPAVLQEFTQDQPIIANTALQGHNSAEATKPVQHVYIHSASDQIPTELNLKLILVKPRSGLSDHKEETSNEHWSDSGQSISPTQIMSDFKRSKINAQLHFVRYKAPPTYSPTALRNPFHSKSTPTLHFLISKRRSEEIGDQILTSTSAS